MSDHSKEWPAADVSQPEPDNGLEHMIHTHSPGLLRYATHLVRDSSAAADVVQQVLIRFCRLDTARRPAAERLRAWLYRATHNQAVDHIRSDQRRRTLHEQGAAWLADQHSDRSEDHDRLQDVLRWVQDLKEPGQQVLRLRLQEGLSYREISEVTGLKEGYIGYLIHQAVRELSAKIGRNLE